MVFDEINGVDERNSIDDLSCDTKNRLFSKKKRAFFKKSIRGLNFWFLTRETVFARETVLTK